MKQTAVEWLRDQIASKNDDGFYIIDSLDDVVNVFKQAKEMEKQQRDDFAIEFAEWRLTTFLKNADQYTMKELLEIFKKK